MVSCKIINWFDSEQIPSKINDIENEAESDKEIIDNDESDFSNDDVMKILTS